VNFAVTAFHDAVRLGAVDKALPRLTGAVAAVNAVWAPVMLAHARALAAHDGPALDTVSAAFVGMGAVLLAAEAAAEAAIVHRRDGKATSALVASNQARALHSLCEGARTRAVERMETNLLTRREREVAALAARGLSNRDIADRLFVSVRTIENQLHRAYGKLGVAKRQELATAFGTFEWRAGHDSGRELRVHQPPAEHGVDQLLTAGQHLVGPGQHERRPVHGLHPTGDRHVSDPGQQPGGGLVDRFEA
jgi:DNA-binding CsgD family transcriptional regulator